MPEIDRGMVKTPQGHVHYRTAGDGPPVLFLHPNTFSSEMWVGVMEPMSEQFRVVANDRIGHGCSDQLPSWFRTHYDYNEPTELREGNPLFPYEDFLEADLNLIDALDIDELSIVGQSTGAHMAMEIAIARPEKVKKLVIMSNSDWPDRKRRLEVARAVTDTEPATQMDGSHLMELWRQRQQWASPATTPEIMHKVAIWAILSTKIWHTLSPSVVLHYDTTERVTHLSQPVLFLDGVFDHQQGIHAQRQRNALPSGVPAEIDVIEDSGYFFPMERPLETAARITEFLAAR